MSEELPQQTDANEAVGTSPKPGGLSRLFGPEANKSIFRIGVIFSCAVLVVFLLTLALLLPDTSHSWAAAGRAQCQNNVKNIGVCIKMYQAEHGNAYPQSLTELYPRYTADFDLSIFVCPSDRHAAVGDGSRIDERSSYVYKAPAPGAAEATARIMREKPGHHAAGIYNVLFGDGHVEGLRDGPG